MKQILRKAILMSEELAPNVRQTKSSNIFSAQASKLLSPHSSYYIPTKLTHTFFHTNLHTHSHMQFTILPSSHLRENSLSLSSSPSVLSHTHTHRKTKTQIVANKTLNLNSTINFDAMQTKLIFPNFNLNLASDALKFILIF